MPPRPTIKHFPITSIHTYGITARAPGSFSAYAVYGLQQGQVRLCFIDDSGNTIVDAQLTVGEAQRLSHELAGAALDQDTNGSTVRAMTDACHRGG